MFNTSFAYYVYVEEGSILFTSGIDVDVIIPFWFYGNYFFRSDDSVQWYRTTTNHSSLDKARRDIQRAFSKHDDFHPLWLLVATWESVDLDDPFEFVSLQLLCEVFPCMYTVLKLVYTLLTAHA